MTNEYLELVNEYTNDTGDYPKGKSLGLMKVRRLDRIADALERIADTLERIADSMEVLDKCVGFQTPTHGNEEGYHFLHIDGYVETDN